MKQQDTTFDRVMWWGLIILVAETFAAIIGAGA